MLGIGVFTIKYFMDLKWNSILMVLCSLFVGLCSSSKRFFLGGVAVLVLCLFIRLFWIHSSKTDYKLPMVVALMAFIMVVLYNLLGDVLYLDYYLQFLIEGNVGESLETRFGEDGAEILDFLKKVASGRASVHDLTPDILKWLMENNMTSKLAVSFR